MPLIPSRYRCLPLLSNGHFQTIYPSLFRRVGGVRYARERLELADGDFLDIDWIAQGREKVAVIAHGLEGHSRRCYVLGMARALSRAGWDVAAWNARGCGGEPNRLLRFTHSGATEDLHAVVQHVIGKGYSEAALVGFSLGGNLGLKYAGERGGDLDPRIRGVVGLSVPCDLLSGSLELSKPGNRIYMKRFLACLRSKIQIKKRQFPGQIDDAGYDAIRTFREFDDRYTAPIHGFESAEDYWAKSSSRPLLPNIPIPALLINARNDPFLGPRCFPLEEASQNPRFFLEIPEAGGHAGFPSLGGGDSYAERRTVDFLAGQVGV